ncbi:MAG: glycosyltransferase family 2 protein [Candidatus Omnitrophota bacterium]
MKYSVVIPVFNEQENIEPLYSSLKDVMNFLGQEYEIIFVNDASTDGTLEILRFLAATDKNIVLILFEKNKGQSAAFEKGFNAACGDIIISLDGDYQNDPADIPKLLDKLKTGYDVVCGWRKNRKDRLIVKILSKIANLSRQILLREKIHDVSCSLRAYKKETLKGIIFKNEMYYMLTATLFSRGYKVGEVEVKHLPRESGNSKFSVIKKIQSSMLFFKYFFIKNHYQSRKD